MAPSRQKAGVQPAKDAKNCPMHAWVSETGRDLYTEKLTDCCVLACWTAESNKPNSLMHVAGAWKDTDSKLDDYELCKKTLIEQIKANLPAVTHVIAVAGPHTGDGKWFEGSWYKGMVDAVKASKALTEQEKKTIKWIAERDLLKTASNSAINSCCALLWDGKYGPSHPPAPPSTSSSDSSGFFGGAAPAGSRPGTSSGSPGPSRPGASSGSKAASPAPSRPGTSSGSPAPSRPGTSSGSPAPSRPGASSGPKAASPAPSRPGSSSGPAPGKSPAAAGKKPVKR